MNERVMPFATLADPAENSAPGSAPHAPAVRTIQPPPPDGTPQTLAKRRSVSTAPYLLGGSLVTVLLIGGVVLWSITTSIAGAVIAPGVVAVEGNLKKVQHPTGGVVGEILVKNGDRVRAGDVLLRLDETVTRANQQIVVSQIEQLTVRLARLEAERDASPAITIPSDLAMRTGESEIAAVVAGEKSLFDSRRQSNEAQNQQLRERIEQYDQEAAGLDAQRQAKDTEIKLIGEQIASLLRLEEKKLVTASKMIALRRESARLVGEQATLLSTAAQTRGKIAEIELTILQRQQQFATEVVKELRETQSRLAELRERAVAADDVLSRVVIRAPSDGIVHQLSANTVGGVVNTADPILFIVPDDEHLVVDAQVSPRDRDQLVAGAAAHVRFSSFNQRTTPEIIGKVERIAAEIAEDRRTGITYFNVRVVLPETEIAKLGHNELVPGIPAEVHITTSARSAFSYLMKPVQDQFSKAFRER